MTISNSSLSSAQISAKCANVGEMMIQSRCKFKLKRFRCRLGRQIAAYLTYPTLVIGLVLMQYDYGKLTFDCVSSFMKLKFFK